MFYVVRGVHKFDSRLVTKHLTNGDQWKDHAAIETHVFDMICTFAQQRSSGDCTHAVPINCVLFGK